MIYPATEAACWIMPSLDAPLAMDDSLTATTTIHVAYSDVMASALPLNGHGRIPRDLAMNYVARPQPGTSKRKQSAARYQRNPWAHRP